VSGSVNDIVVGTVNSQQVKVTVNGAPAQVANRSFLATVPLTMGTNAITATATDRAGNSFTVPISVVRNQPGGQPQIQFVSGSNQAATISAPVASPLIVDLTDAAGKPVAGVNVIFKVTQNNGMLQATGQSPATTLLVPTDADGHAQANWTLGTHSGAASDMVQAYAVGYNGIINFTATANQSQPGLIVVDSGNSQTGVIGQPLPQPFVAVVTDSGFNRLTNVNVTFTVQQGGGSFGGQTMYTTTSDSDGRVQAVLTLGIQEGIRNNLVSANFEGNTGFPATFSASGMVAGNAANTTVTGVVLDNSNNPLAGVTIRAVPLAQFVQNPGSVSSAPSVQTNAQGQFTYPAAPVGSIKLLVDGSTAQTTGTFPPLEYDLVTVSGQANSVGMPIFLVSLDTVNQICVSESHGGTLTLPQWPGFSLKVLPGSATFPGGSSQGCITATPVHGDKVPMVPGFGQQPRFIVTIQPAGTKFDPPAAITLPNVDGLPARAVTEMYSYDHDLSTFVSIGNGTVSADGTVIASNPGVGVLKAGWHCGGDPGAIGTIADCLVCNICSPPLPGHCAPDDNQIDDQCSSSANPCIKNVCGSTPDSTTNSLTATGTCDAVGLYGPACDAGGSQNGACYAGHCLGTPKQCPANCIPPDAAPCFSYCSDGACTGGTPIPDYLAVPCDAGGVQGTCQRGACIANGGTCSSNSDCPSVSDPCLISVCRNGSCSTADKPLTLGTPQPEGTTLVDQQGNDAVATIYHVPLLQDPPATCHSGIDEVISVQSNSCSKQSNFISPGGVFTDSSGQLYYSDTIGILEDADWDSFVGTCSTRKRQDIVIAFGGPVIGTNTIVITVTGTASDLTVVTNINGVMQTAKAPKLHPLH
jgi:hypothetical protein